MPFWESLESDGDGLRGGDGDDRAEILPCLQWFLLLIAVSKERRKKKKMEFQSCLSFYGPGQVLCPSGFCFGNGNW